MYFSPFGDVFWYSKGILTCGLRLYRISVLTTRRMGTLSHGVVFDQRPKGTNRIILHVWIWRRATENATRDERAVRPDDATSGQRRKALPTTEGTSN